MDGSRANSFGNVLRVAMRYRFTFVSSVACALAVAVLWGGNIGAIYPFLQVALNRQSLQDRVADEIQQSDQKIQSLEHSLAAWEKEGTPARPVEARRRQDQISVAQRKLSAEQKAAGWYRVVQPYVERYLPHDPFVTLGLIIGVSLLGTLFKDVFLILHTILVARLSELTTFELRKRFYRRTLRMDLATFHNEGTSDLMSRFTHDTYNVSAGLTALFGKLVREPLKMLCCLVLAAYICWPLLVLSLVVAPPTMLAIRWLAKSLKRANRKAMEEMAQIYTTLEETFRGIKIVKAFTMERQERRRFHLNGKKYYRKAMKIARYDSLSHPLTETAGILIICLAIMAGAWMVLHGGETLLGMPISPRQLDAFSLMTFFGMLAGAADPARKLSEVITRIQQASAASDRIYHLLEREPAVHNPKNPRTLTRHHADLVFDHVDYAYQPGQPILRDVSLRIAFGETIAVVGPNGCGKSTLANLIPRFADPARGEIRLDGLPLPSVRLRDLRRQIGLVTQETVLFDDTVYNNIRYGSPNATREQVVAASKRAFAHTFITEQLSEGYETVVGQSGSRLSGGQRQRIALARAILRDPAIIILDEATSQVDLESEQLIQNVLEEFVVNRTAVIITHRLAALSLADRVVVMDGGQIIDVGTHAELSQRCPFYARLQQFQLERPEESKSTAAAA